MSDKRISTSPSAIQVENRRKTICIEEKLHTISQLEKGERIVDICHNVRHADNSVHTIRGIVDRFMESAITVQECLCSKT
jgi:hypothetical protein